MRTRTKDTLLSPYPAESENATPKGPRKGPRCPKPCTQTRCFFLQLHVHFWVVLGILLTFETTDIIVQPVSSKSQNQGYPSWSVAVDVGVVPLGNSFCHQNIYRKCSSNLDMWSIITQFSVITSLGISNSDAMCLLDIDSLILTIPHHPICESSAVHNLRPFLSQAVGSPSEWWVWPGFNHL